MHIERVRARIPTNSPLPPNSIPESTMTVQGFKIFLHLFVFQGCGQAIALSMNQVQINGLLSCSSYQGRGPGWMKCDLFPLKRDLGMQEDGNLTRLSHWRQIKAVYSLSIYTDAARIKQGWHCRVIALPALRTFPTCASNQGPQSAGVIFSFQQVNKIERVKVTKPRQIKIPFAPQVHLLPDT